MKNYQKLELNNREKQANEYDQWYIKTKGILFDKIEKLLFQKNTDNSKIILDLGSGTGRISEAIQHKNKNIIAIDYSPTSIELLQRKKIINTDGRVADITKPLPFQDHSFDTIVSCQVLQHFHLDDLENILQEINRILKPGGKLIFSVYNNDCIFYNGNFEEILGNGLYTKRFNKKLAKYLANKTGLYIDKMLYYGVNPILHKHNGKVNRFIELLLQHIPYINRKLGKYVFIILKK